MKNFYTPCISVCFIENDFCIGCKRTLKEIEEWRYYSTEEKITIMEELKNREAPDD